MGLSATFTAAAQDMKNHGELLITVMQPGK